MFVMDDFFIDHSTVFEPKARERAILFRVVYIACLKRI